jgi:hypothetical protein
MMQAAFTNLHHREFILLISGQFAADDVLSQTFDPRNRLRSESSGSLLLRTAAMAGALPRSRVAAVGMDELCNIPTCDPCHT